MENKSCLKNIEEKENDNMNNDKEFTKYEYDQLTLCADNPTLYSVNINPNTNDVSIFSKNDNSSLWKLGKCNDLVIKLLKCFQVDITYFNL